MLNWALRYAPIVDVLDSVDAGRVLEVGCGDEGLARYLNSQIVGIDLNPPATRRSNLFRLVASSSDLPVPDMSFDTVVSSDMLEHIPSELRARCVTEMLRVCRRWLVLGFPAGLAARKHDEALKATVDARHLPTPPWLAEHLVIPPPTVAEIVDALAGAGRVDKRIPNSNARLHRAVLHAELTRSGRLLGVLDRLSVVRAIGPVLNRPPTYREVLLVERLPGRGRT